MLKNRCGEAPSPKEMMPVSTGGLILEIDMCGADGMIFGEGSASPDDEACSAFSWMLRSRRFLDALVPASWIDEPNLKVCAGLLHSRLVQFDVAIGNHRASGCESGRHVGPHSNSQHHERHCRKCYRDTFVHEYPFGERATNESLKRF
jgi:hypothetical protein